MACLRRGGSKRRLIARGFYQCLSVTVVQAPGLGYGAPPGFAAGGAHCVVRRLADHGFVCPTRVKAGAAPCHSPASSGELMSTLS